MTVHLEIETDPDGDGMLIRSASGSDLNTARISRLSVSRYRVPMHRSIPGSDGSLYRSGHLLHFQYEDGTTILGEASPLPGFSSESSMAVEAELVELVDTVAKAGIPSNTLPSVDFAYQSIVRAIRRKKEGTEPPVQNARVSEVKPVHINGLVEASASGIPRFFEAVRRGFTTMKAKVGKASIEEEVGFLVKMISDFPEVRLRLDANRKWSLDRGLLFARELRRGFNHSGLSISCVEYFEEPVADVGDMDAFAEESGFRVALDETIREYADWTTVVDPSYVAAVVVKPMLVGFTAAESIVRTARSFAIAAVVSSAFETGIGLHSNLHFASEMSDDTVAGLGTYDWIATDLVVPRLPYAQPRIEIQSSFERTAELDGDLIVVVHTAKL